MMRKIERRLSKGFQQRLDDVVLAIGSDRFTKRDLIERKWPFFSAAGNLDRVIQQFRPRSVKDLVRHTRLDEIAMTTGVGEATLIMLLTAVEWAGIDSDAWVGNSLKLPTICNKKRAQRTKVKSRKAGA